MYLYMSLISLPLVIQDLADHPSRSRQDDVRVFVSQMRCCSPFDLALGFVCEDSAGAFVPRCEYIHIIIVIMARADYCVFSGICMHPGMHILKCGHARLRQAVSASDCIRATCRRRWNFVPPSQHGCQYSTSYARRLRRSKRARC